VKRRGVPGDIEMLLRVSRTVTGLNLCALGDSIEPFLKSVMMRFPQQFASRIAAPQEQPLVELHEEADLVERPPPVLGGEGVDGHPPEPDLERSLDGVEQGREDEFAAAYSALIDDVRSGRRVADDELVPSDVILPPADITFAEAGEEFTGEGLIPE
jgi:hypothetical protein